MNQKNLLRYALILLILDVVYAFVGMSLDLSVWPWGLVILVPFFILVIIAIIFGIKDDST